MLDQLSIYELIDALERVQGKILIPDADVRWLWDSINHQYETIGEHDRQLIRRCFETGNVETEIRSVADDTTRKRYVEDVYIPIVRNENDGRLILKFSFDITDKILAYDRLSAERDKLADITQNSPDAIIMLDEHMQIISWNKGAEEIFGYVPAMMLHQPMDKLFSPDALFVSTLRSLDNTLPLNDTIKHQMTPCITQSGQHIFCELTLSFVTDDQQRLRETVLILRDKTKQKQLEDEIKRNLDNISKINEISALIHASLELDEIFNMILVAVTAGQGFRFNRAFLFLMNDDKSILEGKKAIGPSDPHEAGILWNELAQGPQTLKEILTTYKAAHDGRDLKVNQLIVALRIPVSEKNMDKEYQAFYDAVHKRHSILITRDNAMFLTDSMKKIFETDHLAIVPLLSKDGVLGALVVDNSITGRPIGDQDLETLKIFGYQISAAVENAMLYERLRNKVDELEEAHGSLQKSQERLIRSEKLAAIGELSAKMAHEIRNPLVAIGGFARAILNRHHDPSNETYLKVIVDETMRLERILNDTLMYARTAPPEKIRQPVKPVVHNALALLQDKLEKNSIYVETNFDDPAIECEFDAGQLQQALLNVLINAIEAMPNGGTLLVHLSKNENGIALNIIDSGEGIPEHQLPKIFDPFFTTKQKGSGLGLVVVQEILERHGMAYQVKSNEHHGTTFSITLPS